MLVFIVFPGFSLKKLQQLFSDSYYETEPWLNIYKNKFTK